MIPAPITMEAEVQALDWRGHRSRENHLRLVVSDDGGVGNHISVSGISGDSLIQAGPLFGRRVRVTIELLEEPKHG